MTSPSSVSEIPAIKAEYDAIVIGGGPAGSTAATAIAKRGHSVLVLERQEFPRFHIGESMLTYGAALFQRLGLTEYIEAEGFPVKTGAEFCDGEGRANRVDFTDQGEGRVLSTYQVERADFDQILLQHAARNGAEVFQNAKVTKLLFKGDRIVGVTCTVNGQQHTVHARRVLDASGRAGVIPNQHFKARKLSEKLKMIAVFKHFGDIKEETNPGAPWDIVIGNHDEGWVWAIPVRHDKLSVGTVTRPEVLQKASSPDDLFNEHVKRIPRIHQRIAEASVLTELKAESDFSYYTNILAGQGFFVLGDSGCFVDPIFSSGVYLAVSSGLKAGEMTADLFEDKLTEYDAIDLYTRFYKTGYDCYFRLIYAFYEHDFKIGNFLKSTGVQVEPVWVARLLGGDFWSKKNALANHLRSIEKYSSFSSYEPLFGCPVYPEVDASETDSPVLGVQRQGKDETVGAG